MQAGAGKGSTIVYAVGAQMVNRYYRVGVGSPERMSYGLYKLLLRVCIGRLSVFFLRHTLKYISFIY